MNSEESEIDFEKSIGPWLGRTMKTVDYYLQEAFDRHNIDVTKEQIIVLKKLNKQDGLTQNELAALIYRDKSSLTRLLSKMEKKGYIERVQNNDDKRINQVFLTDTGKSLLKMTLPIFKQIISIMEDDIADDEKELIIQLLKKIQLNFTTNKILV